MSKYNYFSDYDNGQGEELEKKQFEAIQSVFNMFFDGNYFSEKCPKKNWQGVRGTDDEKLFKIIQSKVPQVISIGLLFKAIEIKDDNFMHNAFNVETKEVYELVPVMDLINVLYQFVSKPILNKGQNDKKGYDNDYFTFDKNSKSTAQKEFREEINDTFQRQKLNFELQEDGKIIRTVPPQLEKLVYEINFNSGDTGTDELLNKAYSKFKSPDVSERKIGLKELWDAFERIKTHLIPNNKKTSVDELLNIILPESPVLKKYVAQDINKGCDDQDNQGLTSIGNKVQIRHFETDKEPLNNSDHIDYLFYRMSATIHLLLTGLKKNDPTPN